MASRLSNSAASPPAPSRAPRLPNAEIKDMEEMAELNTLTGQPMASQAIANAFLLPSLVGWSLNLVLWGAVINAGFSYIVSDLYRRDTRRMKLVLWTCMLLSSGAALTGFAEIAVYGTRQLRDAHSLFLIMPIDTVPLLLLGLTALVVQTTLALRASKVFGRRTALRNFFVIAMLGLIFVGWLANVGSCILNLMIALGTEARALPFTYNNLAGTSCWLSTAVDLGISLTLFFQLKSHKTGSSTDSLLMMIASRAMRAAVPTALFALLGAIMATCFPTDQLSTINAVFAFSLPLPSLYTLSMIYTLSSRPSLQLPTKRVEGVALGRLDPRASRASTSFAAEGVAVQHEVVVTTEVAEVDLDGLLFRSSLARPKSERLVQPPPSLPPSDGKWQKERDCADW